MDLVLDACDSYLLDAAWGQLPLLSTGTVFSYSLSGDQALGSARISLLVKRSQRLAHNATIEYPARPQVMSAWPRDYMPRQFISLFVLTLIGAILLYIVSAALSYRFLYDHELMKHPRFLKNQVQREIHYSLKSIPGVTLLTIPWFVAEVRGYSRLYDNVSQYGLLYLLFSIPLFLVFTDVCIYWIHRLLHHRLIYKYIHKPHHQWIVPTPFASHAMHPVDAWMESVPYHLFVFVFPMQRFAYLGLFVFVNVWTVLIHDSGMITGHWLETVINGPAHHTLHHMYFTVNYGQYLTWADRAGGSYRQPMPSDDPLHAVPASSETICEEVEPLGLRSWRSIKQAHPVYGPERPRAERAADTRCPGI